MSHLLQHSECDSLIDGIVFRQQNPQGASGLSELLGGRLPGSHASNRCDICESMV